MARISCKVSGLPMPDLKYYKNQNEFVPTESEIIDYNPETGQVVLDVTNPEFTEPVQYSFEAINKFGRAIGNARLVVEEPKPIEISPTVSPLEAQMISVGGLLVLQSDITGLPVPNVQWLRNGKPIEIGNDVTITTEFGVSVLKIRQMNRKRVGKYEIIAKNTVGEARTSCSVVVTEKPTKSRVIKAPRFIKSLQPCLVAESETVILETVVESQPLSSFQWFMDQHPIESTHEISIVNRPNKSSLIIKSFDKELSGVFTCRAENIGGSVTTTASVNIEENKKEEIEEFTSPRFTERIEPQQLMDGQKLILKCIVEGNPRPKAEWFKDGIKLKNTRVVTIIQELNGTCTLIINEVYPEDAGIYECHAINNVGETFCKAPVSVEGIIFYNNLHVLFALFIFSTFTNHSHLPYFHIYNVFFFTSTFAIFCSILLIGTFK